MEALLSPKVAARIAGVLYFGTIVSGLSGTVLGDLIGGACYVAITALLYRLFKPVCAELSLVAACFSIVGTTMWSLSAVSELRHTDLKLLSLFFFGFYCLLLGYLIYRSTFLPKFVGVLMGIAGACYLFDPVAGIVGPHLLGALSAYILLPGLVGEGAFTLWLLAGIDEPRFLALRNAPTE